MEPDEGECLSEDTVLAFFAGGLPAPALARIEAHVDGCAVCRSWLSSVAALDADPAAPRPGAEQSFAAGEIVAGRYRIVAFISSGGMGEVYAAFDLELREDIALKTVRALVSDDARMVERMRREVQLARKVTHLNVCRIFDFGVHPATEPIAFLTMELLDGETLAQRIARLGHMAPAQALPLCRQMAAGLAAAHAAGVVHRDFKPHNVMITSDERTVITDFGLAAALADERDGAQAEIAGTVHYMAPEQVAGGAIGRAADVYAFGVVLYQMLTGALPFAGESRLAVARARLVDAPPSVRTVRPELDGRWAGTIERCLARDPAARFGDFGEVIAALAPPGRSTRAPAWLLAAAALALAAGASALIARRPTCSGAETEWAAAWNPAMRARLEAAFGATGLPYANAALSTVEHTLDDYGRAWSTMRRESCEATHLRHVQPAAMLELRMACLSDRLEEVRTQVSELAHPDGEMVARAGAAAAALPPVADCANLKALRAPFEGATARPLSADERHAQGELDRARAWLTLGRNKEGLALAERVRVQAQASGSARVEAAALLLLGQLQLDDRAWKPADDLLARAATAALAVRDDRLAARAWIERLRVVGAIRMQFDQARELERFARATLSRIGSPPEELALLEWNVGTMYEEHGDFDAALQHDRQALSLATEVLFRARVLESLGTVYNRMERFRPAADEFEKSLALYEAGIGASHPLYAAVLSLYGNALWGLGERERSIEVQERGLAIQERALGADHVGVAYALVNLAIAYKGMHRLDRAIELERRAVAILERKMGAKHPDVAQALGNLGRTLLAHGDVAEDLAVQRRALAIATESLGEAHPDRGYYLDNIGEALAALGRPQEAAVPLEEALKIEVAHPEEPTQLSKVRFDLAQALWRGGGDRTRARELARAARDDYAAAKMSEEVGQIDAWLAKARR